MCDPASLEVDFRRAYARYRSGVVKGLEAVIHDCERRLMDLRHRTDAAAARERARLEALRDRTIAQVKEALAALGFSENGENGDGGEAGQTG